MTVRGKVGFTGTRNGMTPAQVETVGRILRDLDPLELHHGACVGADAQIHGIMHRNFQECVMHIHPGLGANPKLRAEVYARPCDVVYDPLAHIERNHVIVDSTDVLIAVPAGSKPEKGRTGGTWATVVYANQVGKVARIVMPDGSEARLTGTPVDPDGNALFPVQPKPFRLAAHGREWNIDEIVRALGVYLHVIEPVPYVTEGGPQPPSDEWLARAVSAEAEANEFHGETVERAMRSLREAIAWIQRVRATPAEIEAMLSHDGNQYADSVRTAITLAARVAGPAVQADVFAGSKPAVQG